MSMDALRKLHPTEGQRALAEALVRGEQALGKSVETIDAQVYLAVVLPALYIVSLYKGGYRKKLHQFSQHERRERKPHGFHHPKFHADNKLETRYIIYIYTKSNEVQRITWL